MSGAFAFTGTPGTGGIPVTDRPDLQSVTLEADNAIGDRQAATFCFDEQLNSGGFLAGEFFVQTYDSDRFLQGQTAAINPNDGRCVTIEFNPNINLKEQGSIGAVDGGAVTNLANRPNYFSNAPLTGSTLAQVAGRSTGPDLIAATARQTDTTVNFTFDQEVDPGAVNEALFSVVADNGVETAGIAGSAQVDNATRKSVRVTFPGGTNVSGAIRYSVAFNAVQTLPQDGNLDDGGNGGDAATNFTANPPGAVGTAASSRPVLETAAPRVDGSSQFLVDYSDDLGNYDPTGVIAILDNGNFEAGQSAQQVQGRTDQKIISFAPGGLVDSEPSAVVAIVSQTGAATTANGNADAPVSSVAVGPGAPMRPGYTTAPDLLTTNIDDTADQAGFTYDEEVDETTIAAANQFVLLVPNGDPIAGDSIAGTANDDKTVIVSYAGDVKAATGVGNGVSAVKDNLANDAPYASISTTNIPLPPTGTVTAVPTTTAAPTVTAVPTQPGGNGGNNNNKRRVQGRIRKLKSPGRIVKGDINAPGPCDSGRKIAVLKRPSGKKLGTDRTSKTGKFRVRTKKHKKGALVVKVRRKETANFICRPISKRVPGKN